MQAHNVLSRRATFWLPVVLCLSTLNAAAAEEVIRLPAVMPASEPVEYGDFTPTQAWSMAPDMTPEPPRSAFSTRYPGQLASYPEAVGELNAPPAEDPDENIWNQPIDARKGFFQEAAASATWLARLGGSRGFGDTQLAVQSRFALPLPSRRHPLLLTPGFAVHYLDGPSGVDVPSRLYDNCLQFRWLHKLSPRWSAELSVTPGVFSDFEQGSDEALRVTGHFGAMWDWTPTFQLAIGVAYLDRQDYRILPVAGFVWKPDPDTEFNIMVPRPKIAKRLRWSGARSDEVQDWIYVAGELGGGVWAVRRESGDNDVMTQGDLRAALGLERRVLFGVDYRLEVAYVFARKIEYASRTPEFKPADTVMLRLGATF